MTKRFSDGLLKREYADRQVKSLIEESDILPEMTVNEIAKIVSDRLMLYVNKPLIKKK